MKDEKLTDYFIKACSQIDVSIEENEISKFLYYKDLLISWNRKMNLTTITDEHEIMVKHFADSLSVLKYIADGSKVIDVGTGAGFPGIPLKIMMADIKITLLDSLGKRILFLEDVVDKLKLTNVILLHERAEDAGRSEHRESYDTAVSRAVAPLNELAEYCLPFVKTGGEFLAMKGANADEEIKEAHRAISAFGGEITEIKKFFIFDNARTIVKISKITDTPKAYPRKAGKPSKAPLI